MLSNCRSAVQEVGNDLPHMYLRVAPRAFALLRVMRPVSMLVVCAVTVLNQWLGLARSNLLYDGRRMCRICWRNASVRAASYLNYFRPYAPCCSAGQRQILLPPTHQYPKLTGHQLSCTSECLPCLPGSRKLARRLLTAVSYRPEGFTPSNS